MPLMTAMGNASDDLPALRHQQDLVTMKHIAPSCGFYWSNVKSHETSSIGY